MAGKTFEEVLRIVFETQGQEGLDKLRAALQGVSDVSDDTLSETTKLVDALDQLNGLAGKSARFGQMSADLEAVTQALDHASREAIQMRLELAEQDAPSKAAQRAYQQLRDEVERLQQKQDKLATSQGRVGQELRDAGVDVTNLASANAKLRQQIDGTTGALKRQAQVIEDEGIATRRNRDALADQDAQFRRLIESGHASADALRRYRDGADGAASGTRNLSEAGGRLNGMFSGLRGLIAPVLAYLSFDAAKRGITNLLGVGSAAENARRSLRNLYGGVEEGNRAYASLRTLAKQNGIAFNDLIEAAKKLKAFGLDPLNGSLQALIDQNAAVGGSMEDLDGKVLALGQAWAKQKLQGEEILQLVERGVPVWDLLQKATGKNVDELQKLSSAGKLGRDVITALYQEIGRANSGAAADALFSLSGGFAQLAARWDDFLQKVADSGVTEYFKKQVQSLIGEIGSVDSLAKRVADAVIGSIEALRRFGVQMLAVLRPLGDLTLLLAKNAAAVFLLVKAYAALKLAEVAQGFAMVAVRAETAAAATAANGVAANAAAGMFGRLGAAIAIIPRLVRMSLVVAGAEAALYFWKQAAIEIQKVQEAEAHSNLLRMSAASLQRDQIALGEKLQAIYKTYSSTAIQGAASLQAMTRDQARDYKFALEQARQYYEGVVRGARAAGNAQAEATARERWNALGVAITDVTTHLEDLKRAADPGGLRAFVATAIDKFDELVTKSKDAKTAVSGVFDGIDLRGAEGIKEASSILQQLEARGKDAAAAVKVELSAALSKVATEDFPQVKAAADAAMAAGVAGAKELAAAVATIGLQRLGVDVDAIKTGFTAAGRSAVDAFRVSIDEVEKLGLTVEQRSRAIAQAFDAAFKQASTKAELAALKAALQDALNTGDIGFAEFRQRTEELDAKLAEVGGSGKKMGADIAAGAAHAASAMSTVSSAASEAGGSVSKMGDEAEKTGQKARASEGLMQGYALAVHGLNDAAVKALTSLNKLRVDGMTASGSVGDMRWKNSIESLTRDMNEQLDTIQKLTQAANEEAAQYDENARRLAELRQQYKWLSDDELQKLIDAESKLKEGRARSAEEAKRKADQVAAAYDQQRQAAEAAAASASALAQRTGGPDAQATAAVAGRVIDKAVEATQAMAKVAATAEVTLRVISEPRDGVKIELSKQQMYEIASAVVRLINQSKRVST